MADSSQCLTMSSDDIKWRRPPPPPVVQEDFTGWRSCWGKFQCLRSRRRNNGMLSGEVIVAGTSTLEAHFEKRDIASNSLNQAAASSSPLVHAPPSSPASIQTSTNLSSVPFPGAVLTLFPLSSNQLIIKSDSALTNLPTVPFSLDTVLVTPPVHSTLTTAPVTPLSTAPFTPPPELAHLTTPPSPEVPFAELLASSLSVKCSLSLQDAVQNNLSDIVPPNFDLDGQPLSESPVGQLMSPLRAVSISETPCSLPHSIPFSENVNSQDTVITSLVLKDEINQGTSVTTCRANNTEVPQNDVQLLKAAQSGELTTDIDEKVDLCASNEKNADQSLLPPTKQFKDFEGARTNACEEESFIRESCCALPSKKFAMPRQLASIAVTDTPTEIKDADEQSRDSGFFQGEVIHSCTTACSLVEPSQSEVQDGVCCSTCGHLASKCNALSKALQETQEKLILIERKETLIDDREKKYKQLIQWLQLEARSQQESIFRLSEELSWQEAAFLDLQAKHLAELGVALPERVKSRYCKETGESP